MKWFFQQVLSIAGAVLFLVSMGMLLTRPTNFAAYLPEIVDVVERQFEDPVVRIVLDPGHGGLDPGATTRDLREKDLALDVARKVKIALESKNLENIEVVMTREGDERLSKAQRVAIANGYPKCYFVSIHFNASVYRKPAGTEIYFASPKSEIVQNQIRRRLKLPADEEIIDNRGERFAELVQATLVGELGTRDRGTRNHRPFMVVREVIGPAILVECAFLSNPVESARIESESFRNQAAASIAVGILTYLRETEQDPFSGITKLDQEEEPGPIGELENE